MLDPRFTYKHLTSQEVTRFQKWIEKNESADNSAWIRWDKILIPSDDPDKTRRKAIDASRIASAQRYAKESRTGKTRRGYGSTKKQTVAQVSRKQLQEKERNQRTKLK